MRYPGIILLCLLLFVPGIFSLPPTDRDESRYVQASRQMLESADYVDIRFQDAARYKKPAGIYWLHAAAAEVTGYGAGAPVWVFRIISVLGGVLAVAATMWLATSMFGRAAGVLSALAMASVFGLAMEARIAKTDAMLLATVVFAQAALARLYLDAKGGRPASWEPAVLFWISLGAGILIKGPITPAVSALTALALTLYDRDMKWLLSLRAGTGLIIMLAVAMPWFVMISWKSGGAFWEQAVGHDLLGKVAGQQESHGFPPGYYSLTYGLFVWPIAYLALRAGLHTLNGMGKDPALRFLVAWYVPFWIILEIIPTKLPHYMLPAYPALAIATGWFFADPDRASNALYRWQVWLLRLALLGLAVVTISVACAPLLLEWYLDTTISLPAVLAFVLACAAGWFGSPAADRFAPAKRLTSLALLAGGFYGLLAGAVLPSVNEIWLSREIARVVERNRPCANSTLAVTGYHEPSMVFLAGTKTRLTGARGAAAHLESHPSCGIAAVAQADDAAFRKDLGALSEKLKRIATVSGLNYTKGRTMQMGIYTLE